MLYRLVTDSRGLVRRILGVLSQKPYKIHRFDSNPCRHSLEYLGWPSKSHLSTKNFMLYRLVTNSMGLVGKKLEAWAKNYTIHGVYSNRCRRLRQNLGWEPKSFRSRQNFKLYRLVTDSRGLVLQKLGFRPKNHIKYMVFIVILAEIRLRIWVDLLNHIHRRRILCYIDWWPFQGVLFAKNWGFSPKNHIKYMVFIVIVADVRDWMCLHILNYTVLGRILNSVDWWQIEGVFFAKNWGLSRKTI